MELFSFTTQYVMTYTATSLTHAPPTRRAVEFPRDVPRNTQAATFLVRAPSTSVCHLKINELDPTAIVNYELLRDERGGYKYVQRSGNGQFDVHYFNAHLRRSILLGRFVDASTASLAHAIARCPGSPDLLRTSPHAAQHHVESLVTRSSQTEQLRAMSSAALADDATLTDDEVDIETLLGEIGEIGEIM